MAFKKTFFNQEDNMFHILIGTFFEKNYLKNQRKNFSGMINHLSKKLFKMWVKNKIFELLSEKFNPELV